MRSHLFVVTILVSGCSAGPDEVLTCDEALTVLATCTSADQAECSDTSPASRRVGEGDCTSAGGKADTFGNRVWGEACWWNWQCQSDTRHTCIQGTCYLRSEQGNSCDRGDDRDCATGLSCADDLSVPSNVVGLCNLTSAPVRPALYAETLRPNEQTEFQEHAFDVMAIQMRHAVERLNGDDQVRRAFHPKPHACVVGDFQVLAAPGELAAGPVFARSGSFPAWVRFSNSTLNMAADTGSKIQGLAIKLMNVPGPKLLEESRTAITQDFLMLNLQSIPTASANEFVELAKAQQSGGVALAKYLLMHPRIAVRVAKVMLATIESVRTLNYWAGNASKHGSIAVKYSAAPCAGTPAARAATGDSFLRAELKPQLAAGTVCFDFFAQKQTDSVAMSIEDSNSVWDPALSPPIKIARLTIPATALDTAEVSAIEATCNGLSFNPWNSAPEYRPLGGMNRSRKFAYEGSRSMRRAAPEPTTIPGR